VNFKEYKRVLGLLALAAFFTLMAGPASAQGISVFVDGNLLRTDQPAVILGGRTFVPLRGIFEALGASVVWDGSTRTVRAQREATNIELTLGANQARVNGQWVPLEAPARTLGGRTVVPLRFVGEALGAGVEWRAATRTVLITSAEGTGTPSTPVTTHPTIQKVVVSPQRALAVGETLTVIALGTAGGQATFDIVGLRTGIAMPEVSPGRYQGGLSVGQGLVTNSATLLVRLTKNGQEDLQEAASTITIGTSGGSTNTQTSEFPASNSVTSDLRPSIGANFTNQVQSGNLRMWVDTRDVTNELVFQGNQVRWHPGYDLSSGQHTARITGNDRYGNSLDRQWSFTLSPGSAGSGNTTGLVSNLTLNPNPPYSLGQTATFDLHGASGGTATFDIGGRTGFPMQEVQYGLYRGTYTVASGDISSWMNATLRMSDGRTQTVQSTAVIQITGTGTGNTQLQVTSPSNGQDVDPNFNVLGQTVAGATVQVQAQARQDLIPGFLSIPGRLITNSARADNSGHFNVAIGATDLASGTNLDITVIAQDAYGTQSAPVTFKVRRK